jgi:hypothetical protein
VHPIFDQSHSCFLDGSVNETLEYFKDAPEKPVLRSNFKSFGAGHFEDSSPIKTEQPAQDAIKEMPTALGPERVI